MGIGRHRVGLAALRNATWLVASTLLWLSALRFFFPVAPRVAGVSPDAAALARGQLALWTTAADGPPAALRQLRRDNPEWDLMARTFAVLSFANLALVAESPEDRESYVGAIDRIIDLTLREDALGDRHHFLLPYATRAPFVAAPSAPRSLFVDGEIALMIAARLSLGDRPELEAALRSRAAIVEDAMRAGPVLSAESYPDECWTFCQAMALAALVLTDDVLGGDRMRFARAWVAMARERLVDADTGMLVSSFTYRGRHRDGPEGSTLFMVAHLLTLIDEPFAADQFARARRHLGRQLFGFAWAKEWPDGWAGGTDVDSGPIVPIVGASAGSSGFAMLAARSFGDPTFAEGIERTLGLAAFPTFHEDEDGRRLLAYAAGNELGDAVLLYGYVAGPLFARHARSHAARGHGTESRPTRAVPVNADGVRGDR